MSLEQPVNFEKKIELETSVMQYAKDKYGLPPEQWAEWYADYFREICDEGLLQRFEEVYDKNPEEFYDEIQKTVEDMFKLHHH